MVLLEGFSYVLQKLNKLATNTNQKIPKYVFVQAFNKAQYTWLDLKLRIEEANKTSQRETYQLITTNKNLKLKESSDTYSLYELPDNFYHVSNVLGKSGSCLVDIQIVEEGNSKALWFDDVSTPSLEFEQSFASFENKYLKVYKKDFEYSNIQLTYFRKPVKVDLDSGFKNLDGTMSTDIDTEWENSNLYEILDIVVRDLSSDIADGVRYQTISQIIKDEN